jgi:hypothetical protein
MNDFGLLVGRYFATLPSLSDAQPSEVMLDSSGRLIISGRYLEDSAHASGDAGIFIMGVRNDADSSLVSDDGDYAPFQLDADGRLKVATVVSVEPSDAEFAEDSAHTSGDVGLHILAVRQDTLAASTSDDGDYADFKVNELGELYSHDADAIAELVSANATLTTIDASLDAIETDIAAIETELLDQGTTLDNIDASLDAIEVDVAAIETELLDQGGTLDAIETSVASIDTEIQSLTHEEDTAHTSGHVGMMPLAVRRDANTSLVDTDGDYAPFQVDSQGRLKTVADAVITAPGTEEYAVTDALADNADGLVTITAAATPWVDAAVVTVGAGETAYLYGYQWSCDQNANARIITDDGVDIQVYRQSLNSSAMPEVNAHFSSEGRIEIPGAADRVIRLQIKKRASTGGNASGSGSLHVRKI